MLRQSVLMMRRAQCAPSMMMRSMKNVSSLRGNASPSFAHHYNVPQFSTIQQHQQQSKFYSSIAYTMSEMRALLQHKSPTAFSHQINTNDFKNKNKQSLSSSPISEYSLRYRRCLTHMKEKPPKKLKTKSAAAKRFRVTGSGKLKRRLAGKQHHAWSKNRTKKNKLRQWKFVTNRSIHKRLSTLLNFK